VSVAATPPTPENVAEMLTSSDGVHHDGNVWDRSIGSSGNVVGITITPYSEDGDELDEVHFVAVVVEGDETPIVIDRATFEQRVNERFDYAIRKLSFAAPEIWPAHIAALREQMLALDVDLSAALSTQGTEDGR
jgi:hypothetical protein